MVLQGEQATLLAFKDEAAPYLAAFFWQSGALTVVPRAGSLADLRRLVGAYRLKRWHKMEKTKTLWEV